jgi:phosphohistidine phosphatase
MKTLLIQRHGKSSWKDGDLTDLQRPLNRRGKEDAPRMARFLRDRGLAPELILCSTAKRACQTAKRSVEAGQFTCQVEPNQRIYDADEPQELVELLRAVPDELNRILLVGHNPCLEEFIEALTAEATSLPTAAVAQVELEIVSWADLDLGGHGRLTGVWRPKELLAASPVEPPEASPAT